MTRRYKSRLATITKTRLDTIVEESVRAQNALQLIVDWFQRNNAEARLNGDRRRLVELMDAGFATAQASLSVAKMEREAREAREGRVTDAQDETSAKTHGSNPSDQH